MTARFGKQNTEPSRKLDMQDGGKPSRKLDMQDSGKPGRKYICIDLKSFYASVECVERGLDPMTTDLVVADPERGGGTICLAVSPSLKAKGVKNRCRVFEIPKSLRYIMAPPRMQKYIDYAAEIYGVYLDYVAPEDIHVYSIDEAFIDVTPYLASRHTTAKAMAVMLMQEVLARVGVRATCGIGTNLYLTKIALDIISKHSPDYIGILDEESYKEKMWDHTPITDFWMIGRGTARTLAGMGIYTMGQVAHADEDMLYRRFGIDAELLIDHAWGRETTTMEDIKKYHPRSKSLSSGQVLFRDYSFDEAKIVLAEMLEQLCLDMTRGKLLTQSVTFYIIYSRDVGMAPSRGTAQMPAATNVCSVVTGEVMRIYDEIVDRHAPIRRIQISCNKLEKEQEERQLSLFDAAGNLMNERERAIQEAMVDIKDKFGRNSMFRGHDLCEGATALMRNMQIGGHRSGDETR